MVYETVSTILEQHDANIRAAEAHGISAGMLCVDIRSEAANWLNELFDEEISLMHEEQAILLEFYEQTRELLDADDDEQFNFDLLLPDENVDMSEQAEALRCWCQGYLFGIGFAKSTIEWPEDCAEIIRDIVEFTKLESDIFGEEDENALMEIHEYLRSAVLIIRDQMAEKSDEQTQH